MEDYLIEYFKNEGKDLRQLNPNLTVMELIQVWEGSDLPEDLDEVYIGEAFQIFKESYFEED